MTAEHLEIIEHAVESRRKQALALAQGAGEPACAALEELLRDPDESVHWFARHALDLALERVERSEVSTVSLIDRLEQATDPDEIGRLCREILSRREVRVRDRMLSFLRHPQAMVRAAVVTGFWGWDDPAVSRAIAELGRDESPRVRGQVLVHVILADRPEARALVLRMTRSGVAAWAQLATVYGLGRARRSWTHRELTRLVSATELAPVARRLAREMVGAGGGRGGGGAEARREDSTVRTDLTRSLPGIPDEKTLLDCLRDADVLLRVHALQNAVRFPSVVTLPELRRMATTEEDPLFLASLMVTLGAVGGSDERSTVLKFLDHPDPRVRANALQVLASMPGALPLEQVTALLSDEAPRVRAQAAGYLFRRDPDAALRHFQALAQGSDNQAREAALFTLARLRDPRVLEVFRLALVDRRRHVYRQAYEVLTGMAADWREAADVLDDYREGQIVGEVIDGEPVSALIAQLDSATPSERIEAMGKLVAAEDPRVEMMLELNLAARDPDVRVKAAQVLSQRHVKQTLPRLHRRLGHVYAEQSARGLAPVPRTLANELAALAGPGTAGDADPELDAPGEPERQQVLGQGLYRAFRDGIPLDPALSRACLEIHSFVVQMESYGPRLQPPARGAVADAPGEPRADGRPEARPEAAAAERSANPEERSAYTYLGAGLVGAALLLMGLSFELGRRAAGIGGSGGGATGGRSAQPAAPNALFINQR